MMTPQDQADINELVDALTSPIVKRYTKPQMVKMARATLRQLRKENRWGGKRNWGHQRRG